MSQVRTNSIVPAGGLAGDGGGIIQIVQTIKTDTTTFAGNQTFVDVSGMSATITPQSSNSKILIHVSLGRVGKDVSNHRVCAFRILRGATPVGVANAVGSRLQANFVAHDINDDNYAKGISYHVMDSPATTSATTYKIQASTQLGNTWVLNRTGGNVNGADAQHTRTSSVLTLMEVSG